MTFVHPLLLGGLALVGIPVLIHLMMRQKPKRLPFPAFRFLLQKQRTNQTRLRLRHFLLLLLRMAIIALLCLVLAYGERPVRAVLVLDNSYSMEYRAGTSRFDEAKRRAEELLNALPKGSQVAVLDAAGEGANWLAVPEALERVSALNLRYDSRGSLINPISKAFQMLAEQEAGSDDSSKVPKSLYVISDRTHGCWDEAAARGMKLPQGTNAVFLDVGVEGPADLAIVELKIEPAIVRPGDAVQINATVKATGADYDAQLNCIIDPGPSSGSPFLPQTALPQSRRIAAGHTEIVTFEFQAAPPGGNGAKEGDLAIGQHQVEIRLANSDAMPFDNAAYATFRVVGARPLLVLADDRDGAGTWVETLTGPFLPEILTLPDAENNHPELDKYAVVCLFNVARPPEWLWAQLKKYVADGHGLFVVLGGNKGGPDPKAYNDGPYARDVLSGTLEEVVSGKEQSFSEFQGDGLRLARHPLGEQFLADKRSGKIGYFIDNYRKPRASRFWKVNPNGTVLLHFADTNASPALLERTIDRGSVLMLTTALEPQTTWNNYKGPFAFVLSHRALDYLAGRIDKRSWNYISGDSFDVRLPSRPFLPTYTLSGPGLKPTDATLTCLPEQRDLHITRATTPGNFSVLAQPEEHGPAQRVTAFSMNPRPEELDLERVPVEQIESLLGERSVLSIGRTTNLRDLLDERWPQPFDPVPWLLIALLLFLAVEGLLANRFYRRPAQEKQEENLPLAA